MNRTGPTVQEGIESQFKGDTAMEIGAWHRLSHYLLLCFLSTASKRVDFPRSLKEGRRVGQDKGPCALRLHFLCRLPRNMFLAHTKLIGNQNLRSCC